MRVATTIDPSAVGAARPRPKIYGMSAAIFALALIFGALLRVDAVARLYPPTKHAGGDVQRYYVSTAESLLSGRGFESSYEYNFIPPPMQALFLAGIKAALPMADYQTMRAAQAVVSIATLALAFLLGRALGGTLVGALAALFLAIDPEVIGLVSTLLAETNYFCLLFAFLLALIAALRREAARWFLGAGVLLGLTCLTKPFPMLLSFFVPLWLLARRRDRNTVRCSALFLAGFLVMVAPWTLRNALRYGGFYPISTNSGVLLAQSNFAALDPTQPKMIYWEDIRRSPDWRDPAIEARYADRMDADGKREWNLYDRDYKQHATRYILAHPLHFLRNYAVKLYNVFAYPPRYEHRYRLRYFALGETWPFPEYRQVLVVLGLIGWLWFGVAARKRPEWIMTLVCAYFALFGALLHITKGGRINLPLKLLLTFFAAYLVVQVARACASPLRRAWLAHAQADQRAGAASLPEPSSER